MENHTTAVARARTTKAGEDVRRRLRRSYWLLIETNEAVAASRGDDEFYDRVCHLVVEHGEYLHAWIGFRAPPDDVTVVASTGNLDVARLASPLLAVAGCPDDAVRDATPLERAQPYVCNDLAACRAPSDWRRDIYAAGVRSFAVVPFWHGQNGVGFLTITSSAPSSFDEEMSVVLSQMSNVITRALAALTLGGPAERPVLSLREHLDEPMAELTVIRDDHRFRFAFEKNTTPMVFTDLHDRAIDVNSAFCRLTGYERHELLGRSSAVFTHPDDIGVSEVAFAQLVNRSLDDVHYVKRYCRKDGTVCVVDVTRSPLYDAAGEIQCVVAWERDVTEERQLAEQLTHHTLYDQLTGLANRHLFTHRLDTARANVVADGGFGAVLLLDLDDFRGVNDSYGHETGDRLLIAVARRLERVTRSGDLLCRFGGDEFLYLADGLRSIDDAERIAHAMLEEFINPFSVNQLILHQRASIGVVTWDETSADTSEILQDAHAAVYEAKRRGKDKSILFTGNMHVDAVHRYALTQELRQALDSGDLSMHYQPIVDLASTRIVGFEALMRWRHPERGWISPLDFVPLAEQSDLIFQLGRFALREAVATASTWVSSDGDPPYVTVNFSALQFQDPNLIPMITSALATSGLASNRLIIEITESVAFHDIATTMSVIDSLRDIGIRFALDDFGTGHSTLSHLALLHPYIIKIDQHFLSLDSSSPDNDVLLEAIVSLGRKLDISVLAEGIERASQLHRLRELSCEFGQGFLFSPAVIALEAASMVGAPLRHQPAHQR